MRVNQVNTRNYQNRQSFKQLKPPSEEVKNLLAKVADGNTEFINLFNRIFQALKEVLANSKFDAKFEITEICSDGVNYLPHLYLASKDGSWKILGEDNFNKGLSSIESKNDVLKNFNKAALEIKKENDVRDIMDEMG